MRPLLEAASVAEEMAKSWARRIPGTGSHPTPALTSSANTLSTRSRRDKYHAPISERDIAPQQKALVRFVPINMSFVTPEILLQTFRKKVGAAKQLRL